MRRSLNSRLYTIRLCLRHPEIALARWRGRGLEPLDAVCVECAGPGAPPPILSPELFRRLARLTTARCSRCSKTPGAPTPPPERSSYHHGQLRDALLAADHSRANQTSEGLVMPVAALGIAFLALLAAPAVLRIAQG